jgi:hypothetical protein
VQRIFESLAPEHLHNDARSLVEYSCFRYLAKDNSDFHPNLKVKLAADPVIMLHVSTNEFTNKITLGLVVTYYNHAPCLL